VELAKAPASSSSGSGRLAFGIRELDRAFGGGIVPGAVALVAGEPGIGKSTLLLQASAEVAGALSPVLYVTGEESTEQIRLRSRRLGISGDGLFLLATDLADDVVSEIERAKPGLVVVDSIQALARSDVDGAQGSLTQVRGCANLLIGIAKASGVPIILSGHVTKDGSIAGPKLLEHMVDVVLQLEGESGGAMRLLRATKNRFGPTSEIGVFEMRSDGLGEVEDPSRSFLSQRRASLSGSAVASLIEGTRPLLVEVQALTSASSLPSPRRVATGVDMGRVMLVVAVLSKRLGLPLGGQDIVVNVAGGLRVKEPAADLAVALAIASSLLDLPVEASLAAAGEVGLAGELRAVPQVQRRAAEAARLGFDGCLVPAAGGAAGGEVSGAVRPVDTLEEAISVAMPGARAAGSGRAVGSRRSGTRA